MAIPKYVRAVRKQFLYMLWLQLGMFVIGVALVIIINGLFNEDRDYACIGTLMALSGVIAGEALQLNNVDFRLAVLMGHSCDVSAKMQLPFALVLRICMRLN